MGIQKCKNCGTNFKYKRLFKVFLNNKIECLNCGAVHEITLGSRAIIMILLVLPSFITIFPESIKENIRSILPTLQSGIFIYLVYAAIIIALSPYIIRYKLKDSNESK